MANTIETILKRRSIRKFKDQAIDQETIRQILTCGMSGPSAVNARDWSFIVVNEKEKLEDWSKICGRAENIVKGSALTILVCGDKDRMFKKEPDFWVINSSIACQNMILAAEDLGLGSVWLGVWPVQERVKEHREYFALPESIIPHSMIAFGYPDEDKSGLPHKDYEEDRVHFNGWDK